MRRAQHQFILIKFCVNSYKISHYLKTVDSDQYPIQLLRFDEMLTTALADVFGCEINPTERLWISLPIKQGGLGIPTTVSIAGASYIASCTRSSLLTAKVLGKEENFNIPKINERLQSLGIMHQLATPITMDEFLPASKPQAFLCNAINETIAENLSQNLTPRQQTLYKAMSGKAFVPWFAIHPSEFFNQYIEHEHFKIAMQFQLGKRITSKSICNGCGENAMDVFGEHATICKYGGGETSRHNAVRDNLASQAIIESSKERGKGPFERR